MGSRKREVTPDYWRQLDVFAPGNFKTPITVIGAGATGSYVVWLLAKMGCRDITVWDFDKVEDHNVPNQIYDLEDVGKLKVEALKRRVEAATGITIKTKSERFTTGALRGIVFVLTDTMESRKQIWESSVRYQLAVDLMIETRMAAEMGTIYAIRPTMPREVEAYEKTLYPDSEAEESACSNRAIAPTVAMISGMAVFILINHVRGRPYPSETLVSLAPFLAQASYFAKEEPDAQSEQRSRTGARSGGGGARASSKSGRSAARRGR